MHIVKCNLNRHRGTFPLKNIALRLLAAILAACTLTACGRKEPSSSAAEARTDTQIISDLISYYGWYGSQADEQIQALLHELNDADSRQGKLWTDIMDFWDYANNEMQVHTDKLPDDLPKDDTLVLTVLGYALNPDGSMQDELIERLKTALACAAQYPNAYVLCTGGGTALNNPDATEGGRMGDWLCAHGLDAKRLIIEDRSRTTAENASNSYDILQKDYPQADSVVIISSSYHIAWGSLLFESVFLKSASEKQTPEIHVVSNCACPVENAAFQPNALLRWEAGGMYQLIGRDDLAAQYYQGFANNLKPAL